jgi:hypothetical protein
MQEMRVLGRTHRSWSESPEPVLPVITCHLPESLADFNKQHAICIAVVSTTADNQLLKLGG